MHVRYYIINLPRSVQRRNYVVSEMQKHQISDYKLIDGLDAKNYELKSLERFVDKANLQRDLPKGMIGCSISHIKALRNFLIDESAERAVILEDDFEIIKNFKESVEAIPDDILDFGPVLLYAFVKEEMMLKKQRDLPNNHGLFAMSQPLDYLSTVGYCVNKSSARNLIRAMFPLRDFPDAWKTHYNFGAFKTLYIVYPFLLRHEVFESDRSENLNIWKRFTKKTSDVIIDKRLPILYDILKKYRQKWRDPELEKIIFI